jgi:hypothetical protein
MTSFYGQQPLPSAPD